MSIHVIARQGISYAKRSFRDRFLHSPFAWNINNGQRGPFLPRVCDESIMAVQIEDWVSSLLGEVMTYVDGFGCIGPGYGPTPLYEYDGTLTGNLGDCGYETVAPVGAPFDHFQYLVNSGTEAWAIQIELRPYLDNYWKIELTISRLDDNFDNVAVFIKTGGSQIGTYKFMPLLSTLGTTPGCYTFPLAAIEIIPL